jgi:osmotically-inducible protein OsmY
MSRAAALALGLAAVALLAGCTGSREVKLPEALTTPDAGTVLKDALIAAAVKSALVSHDPDDTMSVGVSVSRGVVTLRGTVRDAKTRERLIEVAQEQVHVRRVEAGGLRVGARKPRARSGVGGP